MSANYGTELRFTVRAENGYSGKSTASAFGCTRVDHHTGVRLSRSRSNDFFRERGMQQMHPTGRPHGPKSHRFSARGAESCCPW
jgi:hypothetical protein